MPGMRTTLAPAYEGRTRCSTEIADTSNHQHQHQHHNHHHHQQQQQHHHHHHHNHHHHHHRATPSTQRDATEPRAAAGRRARPNSSHGKERLACMQGTRTLDKRTEVLRLVVSSQAFNDRRTIDDARHTRAENSRRRLTEYLMIYEGAVRARAGGGGEQPRSCPEPPDTRAR